MVPCWPGAPACCRARRSGCPGLETPKGPPPVPTGGTAPSACPQSPPSSQGSHTRRDNPKTWGHPCTLPPHRQPPSPPPTPKSAFLSWDSPDLTLFTHFFPYQPQRSVKRERGRVLEMPPTPGSLPEETRAHLPSLRAPCTQFLNVILFRRQHRPEAETR